MPFVSQAYLQYLEQQLAGAGGGGLGPVDIPTPSPDEPTTTGELPPGQGGPGSYPAQTPTPTPATPNQWGQNLNFSGGVNYPVPIGLTPGAPNDQFPLPVGGSNQPPYNNQNAGTESVPSTIPQNQLWPSDNTDTPPPTPDVPPPNNAPPDVRNAPPQQAAGNLPGPPLINFGGLPPGFTESNQFGGGAPIFTPQGFTGPQWSPGGSIFGSRFIPGLSVPGTMNWAPGAMGGNLGTFGGDLAWHMAQPFFGGMTLAQVAQSHPEWLPGLVNIQGGGGDYGTHAGVGVTSGGQHTNQQ